jgi:micrococcal nuclease
MLTRAFLVLALALTCPPAPAAPLTVGRSVTGTIVEVVSGDTVTIALSGGEKLTLRLHGIAAPKLDQPAGVRAREELTKLALQRSAQVYVDLVVSEFEIAGVVFCATAEGSSSTNANIDMVRRGWAWYDILSGVVKKEDFEKPYRNSNLVDFEKEARKDRLGLWADKRPVPPWEWQKKKPNQAPEPTR